MISKLESSIPPGKPPLNARRGAVRSGRPRSHVAPQLGEGIDAAGAQAAAAQQAQFDFRLVEPPAMLRCEMRGDAPPDVSAEAAPPLVGERLLTMNVEIVHHHVNGPGLGVRGEHAPHDPRELPARAVGGGTGEMATGFRLHHGEEIGGATRRQRDDPRGLGRPGQLLGRALFLGAFQLIHSNIHTSIS